MKVIVVGGAGQRGEATTCLLAREPSISELVVADAREPVAQQLADRLGGSVRALALDLHDRNALLAALDGAALLVNASGPYRETLVPCLEAAIEAKVDYCDYSDDYVAMDRSLALDAGAKAAGITAVIAMGVSPGLTNLMAMHAATKLDRVDAIELGWASSIEGFSGDLDENLEKARTTGRASAVMEQFFFNASGKVPVYRDGRFDETDGFTVPHTLHMPEGFDLTCYTFSSAEVLTLPRYLPELRSVAHYVGMLPEQLNTLLCEHCRRVANGELSEREATVAVFEAMASDRERWLARPDDMPEGALFVIAKGTKDGHAATCALSPTWTYDALRDELGMNVDIDTGAVLALTAVKILNGDLERRGALPPEACFEPIPFMTELAGRWGTLPKDGRLLNERLDRADA